MDREARFVGRTMSSPKVSLGMPVWNGAAFIRPTLDSILAQTFTDFELIISDNASTDDTEAICREYAARDARIRYVRNEENLGASPNFIRPVDLARGEYFRWVGHDDPVESELLAETVARLDAASPMVVSCTTDRFILAADGRRLALELPNRRGRSLYEDISFRRTVLMSPASTGVFVYALHRTEYLRRTSLIAAYPHSDLVLIAELRMLGPFCHVPRPLFSTRLSGRDALQQVGRTTSTGWTRWLDKNANPVEHPERRLRREYGRAIREFGGSFLRRLALYVAVQQLLIKRRFIPLRRRLRAWWMSFTLNATHRWSPVLPFLRLWMVLSAMRRRRCGLIPHAFSRPWLHVNPALLRYAARRFSRRRDKWGPDEAADALLTEWLYHGLPDHQLAALEAMLDQFPRYEAVLRGFIANTSEAKWQRLQRRLEQRGDRIIDPEVAERLGVLRLSDEINDATGATLKA